MIVDEMFSSGKYDLPITLRQRDMKTGLSTKLTEYIRDLEAAGAPAEVIARVRAFRRSCSVTLSNYFRGIHSLAYDNFKKALSHLSINDSPLLSTPLGDEPLFRGRVNTGHIDFGAKDMFHIPLDRRTVVTSQRYSFPGLPCLYLAASAYTCWAELGKPSFDTFQVAMFLPKVPDAKVVDLSRIPQQLENFRHEPWFSEEEYLLYWPLVAICALKNGQRPDAFKPEYIFPQFFLEHIQQNSNEHVGIRYASIKCERQLRGDWHTFTNYVFPTSSDNMHDKADARLASLFEMVRNRSGKELQILSSIQRMEWARTTEDGVTSEVEQILESLAPRKILTSDGLEYPYALSPFGMIELALRRSDFGVTDARVQVAEMAETAETIDEVPLDVDEPF